MASKNNGRRLQATSYKLPVLAMQLVACALWFVACGQSTSKDTKFQQYYVQGEQLYIKNCSNCHQKNGNGLGRVYPPLNTSDYMDQHRNEVICLIKYGKEGEIIVNGKKYNMPMKGIASLTELEIAEIATYIYNTWSHQYGRVEISEVQKALAKCQPK
jgi:mono/diheme cytochrome c family protein